MTPSFRKVPLNTPNLFKSFCGQLQVTGGTNLYGFSIRMFCIGRRYWEFDLGELFCFFVVVKNQLEATSLDSNVFCLSAYCFLTLCLDANIFRNDFGIFLYSLGAN